MFGGIFAVQMVGVVEVRGLTIGNREGAAVKRVETPYECIEQPSTTKTLLIPEVHSAGS